MHIDGYVRNKFTAEERNTPAKESELKSRNRNVVVPILRIGKKRRGSTNGPYKKYTPTKLRNRINDYFTFCETTDRIPSIKGLYLYLGITKETWYSYKHQDMFRDLIEEATVCISEWCENDVYRTPGQAAGKIAYMKNLHEWSEKIQQDTKIEQKELTADEARAKIEALAPSLAPLLLEMMKNKHLMAQLEHKAQQETEVIDVAG